MRRREAVALIGGAVVAWPGIGVFADVSARRPLVAMLMQRPPEAVRRYMNAFAQGMQKLGLVEGRDFDIVQRSANSDPKRVPGLLTELIGLKPDVMLTGDTALTLAAKRATEAIPIVGVGIADPVGFGLVASLARPGGNVTGLLSGIDTLPAKQLELLLQVVPGVIRVGILLNVSNPGNVYGLHVLETDTAALPLKLVPAELRLSTEIEPAFQTFTREHIEAVFVSQDGLFFFDAERIASLALAARLPTVFGFREHVEAGGLMSYGLNRDDLWRHAASYVEKILKGAKPADLPVELHPKLELVINLKTAKALGVTVPAHVLAFADEVIE
jgi:putative tryptophan/tyrosine transport system substrate-binding protein